MASQNTSSFHRSASQVQGVPQQTGYRSKDRHGEAVEKLDIATLWEDIFLSFCALQATQHPTFCYHRAQEPHLELRTTYRFLIMPICSRLSRLVTPSAAADIINIWEMLLQSTDPPLLPDSVKA